MHQTKPVRRALTDMAAFFAPELRAWRGEASLPAAFWLHGVGGSAVLLALLGISLHRAELLWEQALLVAFGLYTAFVLVAIWRCARNADSVWSVLARVLTAFWAANTGLVLFFLQLELLARYAGA